MEKEESYNLKTLRMKYLDRANECIVAGLFPECHEYFMNFLHTIPDDLVVRENIKKRYKKIMDKKLGFDKETFTKYKEVESKCILDAFYWKQGRDKDIILWFYRELLACCMQQSIKFDLIEKKR